MKKVILASVISSLVSAAAFAGAPVEGSGGVKKPQVDVGTKDNTSATLTWKAEVPVIIPGQWVTLTGANGSMDADSVTSEMQVKADGSFTSSPIKLEMHTYDDATNTVNGLLVLGGDQFDGAKIDKVTYSVEKPEFVSQKGTDVTNVYAQVDMNGINFPHGQANAQALEEVETFWTINGSGITSLVGGDNITATTVVRADVDFVS